MQQLIIVEDDRELNRGLCRALKTDERHIISCGNKKEAREQLMLGSVSLIILDVNLPDGSGLELLEEVKTDHPETSVILLTANDTDIDIVEGLEKGADDYITKPFSLSVLRARVNTQLRRIAVQEERAGIMSEMKYESARYSFDFGEMKFTADGETAELSKTEQKLLRILVDNRGIALSRSTLIDRIWTDGASFVDENALSVAVKRLRDKLDASAVIKTVYGIGYMWKENDE